MKFKKIMSLGIATCIFVSSLSTTTMAAGIKDIGNHWAKNYIQGLVEKKVINGYPDGTFKPENNITREEATTIVANYIGSEEIKKEKESFSDVKKERWSYTAIENLVEKKVINGYPDGTFKPVKDMTRAEFAAIINIYLKKNNKIEKKEDKKLKDIDKHWAKPMIEEVANSGYINGYPDGTFRPENNITRAEVATIIGMIDGIEKPIDPPKPSEKGITIYESPTKDLKIRADENNKLQFKDYGFSENLFTTWTYNGQNGSYDGIHFLKIGLPGNLYDVENGKTVPKYNYRAKVISHDELNYACFVDGEEYYAPETFWQNYSMYKGYYGSELFMINGIQLSPEGRKKTMTVKKGDVIIVEIKFEKNGNIDTFWADFLVREVPPFVYLPSVFK